MIYPEKLDLDQVSRKQSALSTSSWCSEALESEKSDQESEEQSNKSEKDENSLCTGSSTSVSKQFIQDRIRHLVNAFTLRTREVKRKIEMPPTPSSFGSKETVEMHSISRTKKTESLDKSNDEETIIVDSRGFCTTIRSIYQNGSLDPQGKFYVIWMLIAAFAVLYNVWVIPLRSTFPYQTPSNRPVWMFFDYFADIIYVIDLDLLSLLPLDFLYFYFGPEKVILRLTRFFKLHTFWSFFDFVDKLIASPHIIRITRTLMYMMYLIHLNACAYYAISAWEGIGSNNFVYNGKGNAYIVCFYFATKTATSIGKNPKPTQEAEFVFMTFSWLMGVFVFALLIGQIRDIIATATRSQNEYKKLVDETLEYMRRLNLPQNMQSRVKLWFTYNWKTQRTLDENTIMDCLPHKTKTDIAINVHIKTLSKVNLFSDCDEALLRELVLQLQSVLYLPGDIICKKGDVGQEMYIVKTGVVEVIGCGGKEVLATLSEGCVFGEISLLGIAGMNRRTADVRSRGYSNLFVLSKADLNEALRHYPEAQELLNKKAKYLMKQNEDLERKNNALIVINNPSEPEPQPKLLETVLQVFSPDSKVNQLLRYGSKGKPKGHKHEHERCRTRRSLPITITPQPSEEVNEITFQTKVTVHRSLS